MVYKARAKLLVLAWANGLQYAVTETPDVCYAEAAAKVDRLHGRLCREWPGQPLVWSKLYQKRHKKEWFSARASNPPEFIPEDSKIGQCIVSVKKPALKRPESF